MGYKQYCKEPEKIENYEKAKKDNFKGWHCHHRLETQTPEGKRRGKDISHKELIALGLYYNRPADELIFLTTREHHSLHDEGENHPMYGKHHTGEARRKMAEANKGKHLSAETKKKMAESHKGKNIWTKGTRWFNNGKINIRAKECPEGFIPGRLR